MSNLAEKLPKFFRDRVEDLESRGRRIADRFDSLVDQYVPEAVIAPLRTDDGLSIQSLRTAVNAAGEEIVNRFRGEKAAEEKPAAKKPAAKKPAAKKPVAKKPAAKKPAAKKPAAKKPAVKKAPARKPAAKKTTARKPAAKKAAAKKTSGAAA
jgi:cell division septation protein DedD